MSRHPHPRTTITEWSIYKILCLISGKAYIGITKTKVSQRWRRHINTARRGSPIAISCAIRKYGEGNFSLIVLTVAPDFEKAAAVERALIAEHRTLWPNGYNLTTGGEATMGRRVSDEARARMSASAKARPPRPWTDEQKAKASVSRKLMLARIGGVSAETVERMKLAAKERYARPGEKDRLRRVGIVGGRANGALRRQRALARNMKD